MDKQQQASIVDDIVARLRIALKRRFGEQAGLENVTVATLGGSNRTLLFDLVEGTTRRRLVFRQETYRLPDTPFISPHDQYRVLEIVNRHHIPVPEPIFELEDADELDRGYVVACVDGETLPRRLLNDRAFAAARAGFPVEAGTILGRLHRIDSALAEFLAPTPDSIDPIAAQRSRYEHYGEEHPALELGFRWLETHRAKAPRRCLVHGDFRNGNLIMGPDRIRAVLDWECAHLGSPMEDLAWLCLRSWRFGHVDKHVAGFGDREPYYAAYEKANGHAVDREEIFYWEIFGFVRWAILNIMQRHGHTSGERRSAAFAACGRNTAMYEYDLLMTLIGRYT
ncbi:MAG: phosphotransferase family protein [Gammaproteobacteria bacterium]|nr:phosphotransferase family protein [Gammaproteobacteria bacterium]